MTELLRVRGAEVRFRARGVDVRALDGVDLTWRKGEVLGVVGESGSGKTTLARALMGLQPMTAGGLELDGSPVSGRGGMRRLRARIQMIFQDPYQTLNPRHRVRTIVTEPLRVQGIPKTEHARRVAQAMSDVGLDPDRYLDRYPHELSGGQRQRVAIAAALVLEPEGLICDEPTSMLDVSVRAQVLSVLMGLRERRGLALIFITHDLSLAWSVCDRVAVMYLGKVVEEGPAVTVVAEPLHPYSRALVAAVPRVDPPDGRVPVLAGDLPDPGHLPTGCRFHPRCPARLASCDDVLPLLAEQGDDHLVACHLYGGDLALPYATAEQTVGSPTAQES